MNKVNLCWVISDSRKGHEIQSTTLAKSIAQKVKLFRFESHWLQRITSPNAIAHHLIKTSWQPTTPDFNAPPDLIISCGRQAAAAARYVKQKTGSKHIHILNPKGDLKAYDLLLLPEHDEITADNVCHFTGSIHNVRELMLHTDKGLLENSVAVMVGNPEKSYWQNQWPKDWQQIKQLNRKIILCGSPRLSNEAKNILKSSVLNSGATLWLGDEDGKNPYQNLLCNADRFFVTADSINMMNECLATGKVVKFLGIDNINSRRHQNFIQSAESYLSAITGKDTNSQTWPDPLAEIINCPKLQNLLKSPASFNKG